MSIFVPPRVAAALVTQNLVNAILQFIVNEPDPASPIAGVMRTREKPVTVGELKDAYERLGVPTALRDQVMRRLLRERLVRTDGTRVWVGEMADLRAFANKKLGGGVLA